MRDYDMSAIKSRKSRSRKIRWHFLSVLNPPVGENRRTRSTLKWMTAWRHPQSNRCTYQLSVALWEGWPARGKGQVPGPVKTSWLVSPHELEKGWGPQARTKCQHRWIQTVLEHSQDSMVSSAFFPVALVPRFSLASRSDLVLCFIESWNTGKNYLRTELNTTEL